MALFLQFFLPNTYGVHNVFSLERKGKTFTVVTLERSIVFFSSFFVLVTNTSLLKAKLLQPLRFTRVKVQHKHITRICVTVHRRKCEFLNFHRGREKKTSTAHFFTTVNSKTLFVSFENDSRFFLLINSKKVEKDGFFFLFGRLAPVNNRIDDDDDADITWCAGSINGIPSKVYTHT